jgi:capsular polysaccharide transport system permease protein
MQAAALTQIRVVGALVLREARTRFGRSQLGYLWSLVEPVAVVATFTIISMVLGHVPPYGASLPMFFALGALAFHLYRRVASFCGTAFDANQALLGYPVVKPVDTLIARAGLEVATCVMAAFLLLGALIVIGGEPLPRRPEVMAAAALLLVLLGFGHGALNAVIGDLVPSWRTIEPMLARPLFVLSGVFFVPDRMPPRLVEVLAWNPVLHGIELVRLGYYPDYRSPTASVMYLVVWALGLTVVGLAAERALRVRGASSEGLAR